MAGRNKTVDPNVKLSKALSWLLRHGAEKEGFVLLKGGYLFVEDILKHPKFQNASVTAIEKVVETNEKKRFALEIDEDSGKLKIRANQGHTLQVEDLDLTPIEDADKFPNVIHGTDKRAFQFIAEQGLKKMKRNHIHFAAGEPGDNGVISGMRQSCSVIIFIDLKEALKDGFKFFQSSNGVILCPGNDEGVLPTSYFHKVLDRTTREKLPFNKEKCVKMPSAVGINPFSASNTQSTASVTVSAEDLADEFDNRKGRHKKKGHTS